MSDELKRHLDGELPRGALDAASTREAEAWDRLLDAFRAGTPRAPAPAWLEDRVMAEIDALSPHGPVRRAWAWLARPRPIRVSPLAAGLAAAALAAVLLRPPEPPARGGAGTPRAAAGTAAAEASRIPSPGESEGGATRIYVRFTIEAPGASSVAVAGDFTGWEPTHPLEDPDGDGVWTGHVPVSAGVHTYMFVLDGSRWVTDPHAPRYADDGFGNRNAVLAVAEPVS